MNFSEIVSQLSHAQLEELSRLVESELIRRWKSYEENTDIFQQVIEDWSTERLERFLFMTDIELEYGRYSSPPKTYELAKNELEKRKAKEQQE